VLRPLEPVEGLSEYCRVKVTVEMAEPARHPLADCIGILPDEDAEEMRHIIGDEFERVNLRDWE
jgi:hypothetical protein